MLQRALSDMLGIFPSRLVLLLDELEKRGLVERHATPPIAARTRCVSPPLGTRSSRPWVVSVDSTMTTSVPA